jgi:hypothetical protein
MKPELTKSELSDRIEMLEDAYWQLKEVITLISSALEGTMEERHAHSYIIPHLKSSVDGGRYDSGIQQYIDALIETREEASND